MSDVLFTASDLAEMRAFNAANLPHTCDVEHWTRVREPGGTFTSSWVVEQDNVPCRLAIIGTPEERLASGTLTEFKDFRVDFAVGVTVEVANRKITITHDIPALPSPLTLYPKGSLSRTYEMQRTVLASTVGGP